MQDQELSLTWEPQEKSHPVEDSLPLVLRTEPVINEMADSELQVMAHPLPAVEATKEVIEVQADRETVPVTEMVDLVPTLETEDHQPAKVETVVHGEPSTEVVTEVEQPASEAVLASSFAEDPPATLSDDLFPHPVSKTVVSEEPPPLSRLYRPIYTVDRFHPQSGLLVEDDEQITVTIPNPVRSTEPAGVFDRLVTGVGLTTPDRARHWIREGILLSRDLLFAIAAIVVIFCYVLQPVKVEGTSMLPHLHDGQRIFINKFIYKLEPIERGDIVVFWYPMDPEKSFIKRVIGLPGDELKLLGGKLYINGKLVSEPYLSAEFTKNGIFNRTWEVEPYHYFVMGDNRDASNDSRSWGSVPEMYIYGKAVYRYWPFDEAGKLLSDDEVHDLRDIPHRLPTGLD
ncbi:MAG: signal peptidase I [Acidobacteria bacterium]|nr:signal peptidase I [Acidobacteriota bacterium]